MANEGAPIYRMGGAAAKGARAGQSVRASWRAWAMALAWYVATVLILAIPALTIHPYPTRVGEESKLDVKAPYEFTITDTDKTRQELDKIWETLDHVWIHDDEMSSRALQRLDGFMSLLRKENPNAPEKLRAFVQKLDDQLGITIDMTAANQFQPSRLRSLRPPLNLDRVQRDLSGVINALFQSYPNIVFGEDKVNFQAHLGTGRIKIANKRGQPLPVPKAGEVLAWPLEVRETLSGMQLPNVFGGPGYAELRQASLELLMSLLGPTLSYDASGFDRRYEQRFREREQNPVTRTYKTDDPIVKKGERLSQLQADTLARLNEITRNTMAVKIVGIVLVTAIFYLAIGFYLVRFRRDVVLNASMVTLHVLPPLMAIALGQTMTRMNMSENTVTLWFPAALVGLLSSILMSPQVAFVLTLAASCLFGIVNNQDLSFLVFALFGGFAAVFASRRLRARGEVLLVGVQVGLVNVITLVILRMLKVMQLADAPSLMAAFLSGIACAFGTLVLLVLFERTFGIITDLRLLELTGLRNPLIAQFEEKAPGSYQHVLNVVKLAEAAAQAIGANYLLVRAGAYFHDIGKMIKPKYFSENQVTLDDKRAHSRLSPYMSVLIIKNHVKEGIQLARDFHLPSKVIDFIPQHHGSGLIRYFYTEAMKRYAESGAVDEPREEDFRYPGPKPQSIEAAVVMLADSVEAVAASKFTGGQVSEGELRKLVQTAITDKFDDGQFDECDLTMRHLHLIRESFVKTLLGRYHFRVAYPTMPPKRDAAPRETREPAIAIAGPGGPA